MPQGRLGVVRRGVKATVSRRTFTCTDAVVPLWARRSAQALRQPQCRQCATGHRRRPRDRPCGSASDHVRWALRAKASSTSGHFQFLDPVLAQMPQSARVSGNDLFGASPFAHRNEKNLVAITPCSVARCGDSALHTLQVPGNQRSYCMRLVSLFVHNTLYYTPDGLKPMIAPKRPEAVPCLL